MATKHILRFGIIGCGLIGREFARATACWSDLLNVEVTPRIVGVCDTSPQAMQWFRDNFESISIVTNDYHDLLASLDIDAIYCAVPHNLHERIYIDCIEAGKHLLGEKPFGIDLAANKAIMQAIAAHPEVFVRVSSEFPFFPGAQKIVQFLREERFGTILDVQAGFLHSSDLDPNKPINWKRRIATNGEYGCMGDLGLHVVHIPFRFGWFPRNVRACLSNIFPQRPAPNGTMVPCDTWDNATLLCEVETPDKTSNATPNATPDQHFPMTLETKRIAPGETNTWYIRISGTSLSAQFSTKYPKTLRTLPYIAGGAQNWQEQDLGTHSAYPIVTGSLFEFGFSDANLQMWAAFCDELASVLDGKTMQQPFSCVTPQEAHQSHLLFTAALQSQRDAQVVSLRE